VASDAKVVDAPTPATPGADQISGAMFFPTLLTIASNALSLYPPLTLRYCKGGSSHGWHRQRRRNGRGQQSRVDNINVSDDHFAQIHLCFREAQSVDRFHWPQTPPAASRPPLMCKRLHPYIHRPQHPTRRLLSRTQPLWPLFRSRETYAMVLLGKYSPGC